MLKSTLRKRYKQNFSHEHFAANDFRSNRELEIEKWLLSLGHKVQHSVRTCGLEWDIYLPALRIAFEFNGIHFHAHSSNRRLRGCSSKPIDYHYNKTLSAKLNGVDLYHFWDFESISDVKFQITKILQGKSISDSNVDKNPHLVGSSKLKLLPKYVCSQGYALYHQGRVYDSKPVGYSSAPVQIYEFYNSGYVID